MNNYGRLIFSACLLASVALLRPALLGADEEVAAVASSVFNGYTREIQPDGTRKRETYVFAEGDHEVGQSVDTRFNQVKFLDIARTLTAPLKRQGYDVSLDPQHCDLMLMVYWGRTVGSKASSSTLAFAAQPNLGFTASSLPPAPGQTGPASNTSSQVGQTDQGAEDSFFAINGMTNRLRDKADDRNAKILGYDEDLGRITPLQRIAGLGGRYNELLDDVEEDRYYVVVMAYDFKVLAKEKKRKLLWVTRFSIRAQGNEFDESIRGMADYAGKYFGDSTRGLRRSTVPVGNVEIGPSTVVEDPKPQP